MTDNQRGSKSNEIKDTFRKSREMKGESNVIKRSKTKSNGFNGNQNES